MSRCGTCRGRGWTKAIRGVGQIECRSCKGSGEKIHPSLRKRQKGTYKDCEACGRPFYCSPSKMDKRWCSPGCVPAWKDRHLPSRRAGQMLACAQCGAEFYARPSKGGKFCSRKCFFASGVTHTPEASEKKRQANRGREGTNNPNFKHGKRVGSQIRGFTLKAKGESACRNCGRVPNGSSELHLHHAIPRSLSREARDKLLNGIPLCPKCHLGWHHRSLVLYRDIFTREEWEYMTSVQLTGQRIEAWLDDRYPPRDPVLPRHLSRTEAA